MAKIITMQVDDTLLKQFDEFVKNIGGTRSGILNILMQQCVNSQELPKISVKKPTDVYTFDSEPTIIK